MKKLLITIILIEQIIMPINTVALSISEQENIVEENSNITENNNIEDSNTVSENVTNKEEEDSKAIINEKIEIKKEDITDENNSIAPSNDKEENYNEIKEATINEYNLQPKSQNINIIYQTHVQEIGWQEPVSNGEMAGTDHQSKRVEAIKIYLSGEEINGDVEYQSYIEGLGWETAWRRNGEESGTNHQSKRMEAIRIRLTGELANKYDVYYRVHVQEMGWLDWTKNGNIAGTIGYDYRAEAIEIKLLPKKTGEDVNNSISYHERLNVNYSTHVQEIGWQEPVSNGEMAGTDHQSKRVEAIKIYLSGQTLNGNIEYQSYIEGLGWETAWHKNGEESGTNHQSKRLEAIKIRLTDELANKYDVYYRVHVEEYGWLDWTKNGNVAGTINYNFRIEAIEIKIVLKDEGENINNNVSYHERKVNVNYSAHVQEIGWQDPVFNGQMAGTDHQSKRVEAIKIYLSNQTVSGDIEYQSHIEGIGWETTWHKNGEESGTNHQSKRLEAIRIRLTGELANKYDVYYRVHVQELGWLDWAKNGEDAGTTGLEYRAEAIEINVLEKNDYLIKKLPQANPFRFKGFFEQNGYTYYYDKNGKLANDWIVIDGVKYFFNSLGQMIGRDVRKVIDVSSHNGTIDFQKLKREGAIDGVILRIAKDADHEDPNFKENIAKIKEAKIPYGVYIYSYAENKDEGIIYANTVKKLIAENDLDPKLGIYFDLERNGITSHLGVSDYEKIVEGFFSVIPEAQIYTYYDMARNELSSPYLQEKIGWLARYNHRLDYNLPNLKIWQYSDNEQINGFGDKLFDMSVWFGEF